MTKNTETVEVEREKRYETDVRSDSDYDELPTKARFVLSEADAKEIIRLSALVAANGLHKVEKFDYRTSWLEGDDADAFTEARSDADALNVSENEFWFSGYLKHTNVEVLSERQRISELKEWLGIQDTAKQTVPSPKPCEAQSDSFLEPLCDIARTIGERGLSREGDTREDFHDFLLWAKQYAKEFDEAVEKGLSPGENYYETIEEFALTKAKEAEFEVAKQQTVAITPRVLVVVSGGIADPVSDAGVDVEVFDWDNYKDDPKGTGGVPDHFADLAGPIGVPVGEVTVSTNRQKP